MIQTLDKKIKKEDIKPGFILAHEHLDFDLRTIRKDNDSFMKNAKLITHELGVAQNQGLSLIVEMSNQSMHSNKDNLLKIQNKMAMPIVAATGYYLHAYELNNKKTIQDIAQEFKKHILKGVGSQRVKCGIIGEIATSSNKISKFEKQVFAAAVHVQRELGVGIYTHVNFGKKARQHLKLLLQLGANPTKTIIGHSEFIVEKIMMQFLDHGFYIGIDTIGKTTYLSDQARAQLLIKLIKSGYENQIVLSLDISKQSYLKSNQGHGYGWLINSFYELVKSQLNHTQWRKITFDNIIKVIDILN